MTARTPVGTQCRAAGTMTSALPRGSRDPLGEAGAIPALSRNRDLDVLIHLEAGTPGG